MTRDVTIRGAGIFGLSVAWACVQGGARVKIVDPAGVAAGASGGIVGALAPHVPDQWNAKKAFQLDSLLAAQDFWAGIEAAAGRPTGYTRAGRLQPLADEAAVALARAREAGAREVWKGRATWRVAGEPASALVPDSPSGLWVVDTLSAHLHPRQACTALAAALEAKGVRILPEGADEGAVVWATGWQGLEEMTARHVRLVGTGVKGQAALLGHAAPGVPQVFANGVHVIPHLDGTTAVGSTTERTFEAPDTTDAQLDTVIAAARAAVPALADAPVLERWAGVRPRSRSRAPMLGPHPFRPGHYLANGGFKIGFGMAPGVAGAMADLILTGVDRIPGDFHPERCL
ncbi:FAD-binding oxidoreductase [Salipiger sp. IMCC34102]|uniref:NAD(P)/FAD-dependent oxidoreductase n=1 Tax=Salipiger sp. IMCC34102 TaxID=2510647 RepID=UPI00101B6A50|nr:FAD-binding oxidoreductase [Salipiger sp. IMCC34102]RYH01368.1 FAD-binding oxidoreductase [Salipiger sp. IMCC34102]